MDNPPIFPPSTLYLENMLPTNMSSVAPVSIIASCVLPSVMPVQLPPPSSTMTASATPFWSASGPTPMDWKETPNGYMLKMDVPGVKMDDLKVKVEDFGRVLKITGVRAPDVTQEGEVLVHVERWFGEFERRFSLPVNAKANEVMAMLESGVLTVTIPKLLAGAQ